MAKLPTLPATIKGETLIIYLSTVEEAVSVVLLTERGNKQMLVYFVGKALQLPKVNYPSMEKLVLAIIHTTRRLRRYFQAQPITVVTDQPIKQVLSKKENSVRLEKWAIELAMEPVKEIEEVVTNTWKLFIDSSPNEGGSGAKELRLIQMARRVSDYQIRRIADRGNEEDGPDSRARGDRFYHNRRSTDRGNEKVDRDPRNISEIKGLRR
uniref:Reverse transcriptase domain-containing protein n=1 Tax=Tanacetum cinerariifolium TaxID=118510 RepID=A0A6L2P1F4_TANCI|nr:reverse transcriptase domain-containing protein [Tanacetum cinerariifolium]